jgi:ectoine hydroxylase-related dioxygenase (phytanoyl-CoA dioxygenase family)
VELVLSDNAPGLVDVLDTDEPTVPTYNLTACLEALELILICQRMVHSAQRLKTSLQMWSMMSFVQRNTVKQAQITQFFSATEADTCNLHL